MQDATRISMKNRTGLQMSPGDSQELLEATGGQYAGRQPDPEREGLAETRAEYLAEAGPLGTVPAPVTPVGVARSAARMLKGERMQVFMDKLSERAAFERGGTRLYDGLLAKHQAELAGRGHGSQGADRVSRETLLEFRDQEAEHFMLVSQAISRLGGDPTAQTPCADVVGVMTTGLVQAVSDPRTSLPQTLSAILAAELVDVASWELLGQLAEAMGQDEMVRDFRQALLQEEKHLRVIHDWYTSLVMGESSSKEKSAGKSANRA
jgi:ferritin-like protein